MKEKIAVLREHRKSKHVKILTTVKRSNKIVEALKLPKIINVNPRSAMNKLEQLKTFIDEHEIDIAFISESHERKNKKLEEAFDSENYDVISNLHQRKESGGRPALIVRKGNFEVEDITNSLIDIPWGVEMVWGVITPKNVTRESVVKKIVIGALYSKPNSKKKTVLLDHIAETYNFLSAKFGKGLYWMIAGDTNDLRLEPILQIHSSLKSVVTKPTRRNPDNILDNVITDLHSYYKSPDCLPPLEPDDAANGSPSDHLIVLMEPISTIDNRPARVVKDIVVRPMKQSGIDLFGYWIENESWEGVIKEDDIDKKAENFQNVLLQKLDEFLPSKVRKICSVDQPFCTDEMTRLKRLKCREYQKNRKSLKWQNLNSQYRLSTGCKKR